jgi:Cft2 family RNA processing exonuclease
VSKAEPGRRWSAKFIFLTPHLQTGNMAEVLDCVIITHFHLDHCGALPYFTEVACCLHFLWSSMCVV